VSSKDVQDQGGAVEDLDFRVFAKRPLDLAQLARRQFIIKDDRVVVQLGPRINDLLKLSRPDQRGCADAIQALPVLADDLQTGSVGQSGQFGQ
jgi:hypothetical protein